MAASATFNPTPGAPPPHLAGRGAEQTELRTTLKLLRQDRKVTYDKEGDVAGGRRPFVFFGPRGMGKTALLTWLNKESTKSKTEVLPVTPDEGLKSEESIAELLLPPPGKSKWRLAKVEAEGEVGVDVGAKAVLGIRVVVEDKRGNKKRGLLSDLVAEAYKGKPRALLIDEAHEVDDPAIYRALFNTVQKAAMKTPLLMVLAGTPKLVNKVKDCGATFIERALYRPLGRLALTESMEALRIPLGRNKVAAPDPLLERMAEEGQGYPFFLQAWGAALWNVIQHERKPLAVTQDHVDAARPEFERERTILYAGRYGKLHADVPLRKAAYAVSDAFLEQGTDSMALGAVEDAIDGFLSKSIPDEDARAMKSRQLLTQLINDDFVWDPLERPLEPGIPSFMSYIWSQRNPGVALPEPRQERHSQAPER